MFDRVRGRIAGGLRALGLAAPDSADETATSRTAPAAPSPTPPKALGDPELAAQVYGRATDLWTSRAMDLFRERGVDARLVELSEGPAGSTAATLESRLSVLTQRARGPWIFVRGEPIGGFNQLDALDRIGQLQARALPPSERPKGPARRTQIVLMDGGTEEPPYGERR